MLRKFKWFILPVLVFSIVALFINNGSINNEDNTIDSGKSNLINSGESSSIRSKTASNLSPGDSITIKDSDGWYWDIISVGGDECKMYWSSRNSTKTPNQVHIPTGAFYIIEDVDSKTQYYMCFAWGSGSVVEGPSGFRPGTIYKDPTRSRKTKIRGNLYPNRYNKI